MRRKVLSGDAEELWRTEQQALLDVRRNLYIKKREVSRLCREQEGHGYGPFGQAQQEYDEMMLLLHDQREELDLLKVEQQCHWLTDDESVIQYLEHVQQQVTEREDELTFIMELERETLERQQAMLQRGSTTSGTSTGGSRPGSSSLGGAAPPASVVEEAYSASRQQQNAPPTSIEAIIKPRSPIQAPGDRETDFGGRGAALRAQIPAARDPGGWDARDRGGGDAGVLARAKAMVAERNAGRS